MKATDGTNELRAVRLKRRMSQLDTAVAAGFGEGKLWKIEHGYIIPSPAEAKKLAQVLRWPVEKLFPALALEVK